MTCKTHPDAPHGFDRNGSHSQDRYVCMCEHWEPPEQPTALRLADALEQQAWPDVAGIGRDSEHPRAVVLYLRHEPSDDHLRTIQDALRTRPAQDEALLRQALYVIEAWERGCDKSDYWRDRDDAIAALRERLAQPQMQPCAGRNCGSTNPNLHSAECFEDYEKATGMAREHVIDCPRCGHCCPQS